MFTGLVTAMGTVRALEPTADGARLVLTGDLPPHTTLGDSIAVDGVCVSITSLDSAGSGLRGSPGSSAREVPGAKLRDAPGSGADPPGTWPLEASGSAAPAEPARFCVDLMAPTLQRTTLGERAPGDSVNLEPALLAGDRLGGHIVTGHIDGLGGVLSREPGTSADMLRLGVPARLGRYLVAQGSIAVDGVSLTVAEVDDDGEQTLVTIGLIPTTRRDTTLGARAPGEHVNVEVDLLAKHVERLLQHKETAHA
ncbi:MAG TPA: riboflavin synthase [Ruania sp.]|nr:riboflavin synthase [Ruania sp.]